MGGDLHTGKDEGVCRKNIFHFLPFYYFTTVFIALFIIQTEPSALSLHVYSTLSPARAYTSPSSVS